MEEAVRARDAAREAVRNVTPDPLRNVIYELLVDASMAPGALTLLSARAADRTVDPSDLDDRAAGVQLIYEGLRLTRSLARENPWSDATGEAPDGNLDILAADVMVSRGYFLLARTEAAEKAVATVRTFGRDQMTLHQTEGESGEHRSDDRSSPEHRDGHPRGLEVNAFQLAVVAGATAAESEPSEQLTSFATDLARSLDAPLPDAADVLTESVRNSVTRFSGQGTLVADERVWSPSAGDS